MERVSAARAKHLLKNQQETNLLDDPANCRLGFLLPNSNGGTI